MSATAFSPEQLLKELNKFPSSRRYWIAYSGGMDSHALLKALVCLRGELPGEVAAIHVDHGISPRSGAWATHCREVCASLKIKLHPLALTAACPKGESPEAWAREQRYRLIADLIGFDEMLLTAHHQDDQAETLLLQLMRGAGPKGLAAMPAWRRFGAGWHGRPLLPFTRNALKAYAERYGLKWIEDETNLDIGYDRNYLRHQVIPLLKNRWQGLAGTLARSASHQAQAVVLLDELALIDYNSCSLREGRLLNIASLQQLSVARQKNLLRYWLQNLQLAPPDAGKLQQIIDTIISAGQDRSPCLSWAGTEVRRYRNLLVASKPLPPHDSSQRLMWRMDQPCPVIQGELIAERGKGGGIKLSACPERMLEIRYRCGGETIKPWGSRHHHDLKKLMQEAGIPPWFRGRIPLLYSDGELVAVCGFWIDESFYAGDDEEAWRIAWVGGEEILMFNVNYK